MDDVGEISKMMDWRLLGAVTPVKDQIDCGSCWSFGTTGTIEGSYFLKTGNLIRLSEQQLVDCSWGQGNNGCKGGSQIWAYKYISKNGGIESDESYGRYLGVDGKCHHNASLSVAQVKSFRIVQRHNATALLQAVYFHGPITVDIDASPLSFQFYANGIYENPHCKKKIGELNHAVLVVGYGEIDQEPYWLVKNSWSTYWGEDGYILISRRNNTCGVTTYGCYAILE
ncbi:Cathepsin L1 [Nymphon striatum]|nr:Cathepsin L1 [Nymphon striatum]